jgi:GNAT superfamily N-acetyltransferase
MVSIRRIQLGENEIFKRIRLAALRDSPSAFATTYESAVNRSADSWREQVDSTAQGSDRATFIAFSDDLPIGIAALYRDKDRMDVGEVLQVWVAPEFRSKGVAQKILDAVFQWAGENGFCIILATITKGNERALHFYLKYGFKDLDPAAIDNAGESVLLKSVNVQ